MGTQAGQAADAFMEAPTDEIGHRIAKDAAQKAQQQGIEEIERAIAGGDGHGEQDHRARYHQPGQGQALEKGDDEDGHAQPLVVLVDPLGQAV